jgi:CheY-like chemotaxis protein
MTAFMKATFSGNIIVEQRAARDLRPVLGDPTQLQQVLMNLCVNARDAMPHGGKLSLAAKNVELSEAGAREHPPAKPGPYVTVTITDTGEGIDPEIVGRIFEPFFTTKPANKGTGLGLSTAQGIVRSHQGFISVVSKPGLGTSFTLYIPAAAVVSEPVAAPATDAPPRGQGELILVVDDEASLVTTTRLILEWNGYRVVTASNGGAAIAVFLEHREKVRVVLTDVSRPLLGGGGLTRALLALDPKVRVLATTGLDDDNIQNELRAAGVSGFLPKPCGPRELLEAIHAQLAAPAASVLVGRD